MKHIGKLSVLGAVLAASAPFASATPISAGMQNVAIATIAATSYTSGALVTTASGTFTSNVTLDYVASFTESVYRGGSGATCGTCLEMVFTVTDISGSTLESSTISNYAAFTSNVFYVGGTGSTITTASDNGSGTAINFLFSLAPGQSDTFVDFTNATSVQPGNISVINALAGNAPDLGPATLPATPEPNSLILMGTGLVSAAGMLLRRRRTV